MTSSLSRERSIGHDLAYISDSLHNPLPPLCTFNTFPSIAASQKSSYQVNPSHSKDFTCLQASSTKSTATPDIAESVRKTLKITSHPTRPGRYQLQICDGDRFWAYPVAWSWAEAQALRMLARNSIKALNLQLTREGPPKDIERLHQLIERLYPAVVSAAAKAQAIAGGAA